MSCVLEILRFCGESIADIQINLWDLSIRLRRVLPVLSEPPHSHRGLKIIEWVQSSQFYQPWMLQGVEKNEKDAYLSTIFEGFLVLLQKVTDWSQWAVNVVTMCDH
jgi:hypothetical protein